MTPGKKAVWLIRKLGLTIGEAAELLRVKRGTIDVWNSNPDARPSVDVLLRLWHLAKDRGTVLPFDWFWDGSVDGSVVKEHSMNYQVGARNECSKTICSLLVCVHGLATILELSSLSSLRQALPLISHAMTEVVWLSNDSGTSPQDAKAMNDLVAGLGMMVERVSVGSDDN